MPTLIKEWDDRFIRNGVSNRVRGLNHSSEFLDCVLILLHYRSPGKSDKTRIRQRLPHPRVHGPILRPMSFVDENENIRTVTSESGSRRYGLELINDGRDNALPLPLKHVSKICSCRCLVRLN